MSSVMLLSVIAILVVLDAGSAHPDKSTGNPPVDEYIRYLYRYEKFYRVEAEEILRSFATYLKNLDFIREHNARFQRGEEPFLLEEDKFTDRNNLEVQVWSQKRRLLKQQQKQTQPEHQPFGLPDAGQFHFNPSQPNSEQKPFAFNSAQPSYEQKPFVFNPTHPSFEQKPFAFNPTQPFQQQPFISVKPDPDMGEVSSPEPGSQSSLASAHQNQRNGFNPMQFPAFKFS